jgi:hypothetical protein
MAKKKSKNARAGQTVVGGMDQSASGAPRPDWESVEADFFARESDLYQVSPVENFDDLDKE